MEGGLPMPQTALSLTSYGGFILSLRALQSWPVCALARPLVACSAEPKVRKAPTCICS